MTGTPADLDSDDLDQAALDRTDEEAAGHQGPDPLSPVGFPVEAFDPRRGGPDGVFVDTFEPISDSDDFIHPDDPDAEFGDGPNFEEIEVVIPDEVEEADL